MLNEVIRHFKSAFILLVIFTIMTGGIYPLVVTWIAQIFFSWQANGSMIENNDKLIGSILIGQSFDSADYFWGRPSATSPYPYNAASSSGSNLGPSNPLFLDSVTNRVMNIKKIDIHNMQLIPVDLVTSSSSGLDPEISPKAAYYQADRIASRRHLSHQTVISLIQSKIKKRSLFILGEPRVNIFELNLALDKLGRGA